MILQQFRNVQSRVNSTNIVQEAVECFSAADNFSWSTLFNFLQWFLCNQEYSIEALFVLLNWLGMDWLNNRNQKHTLAMILLSKWHINILQNSYSSEQDIVHCLTVSRNCFVIEACHIREALTACALGLCLDAVRYTDDQNSVRKSRTEMKSWPRCYLKNSRIQTNCFWLTRAIPFCTFVGVF